MFNNNSQNIINTNLTTIQLPTNTFQTAINGEHGYFEGIFITMDTNEPIWIEMQCTPFLDRDGNKLGGIAVIQNTTEKYNNKQLIQQLISEQKNILENSIVGMATLSDRKIKWVNSFLAETLGYTQDELIGKTTENFYVDKSDYISVGRDYYNIQEHELIHKQVQFLCKDGTIIWVDMSGKTLNKDKSESLWIFNIATDRKKAEEEINKLAFYDDLTLLPNRRTFYEKLNQSLDSISENKYEAVLFIDLDNFKTLNDTLGHLIGDILLQQVASRLLTQVDKQNIVARLGGDEFVILLKNLDPNKDIAITQIKIITDNILLDLNRTHILNQHEYKSTISIGATLFNNNTILHDELLKQADIALYNAKKLGKNQLSFFNQEMQDTINISADIEKELRKAIIQNNFQLYYQIQVNSNGTPTGAEVLTRWIHPERGIISPFHFIPVAESTGLIIDIGLLVLDAACQQLQLWSQNIKTKHLEISVNVSAKQFLSDDFTSQIINTIQKYNINLNLLKLEITESTLLDNVDNIISIMNSLGALGIKFSLDDFGTGYSSLQYLKALPLDQLKIDQSFVKNITTNKSDRAIVNTIISIANSLELDVIAEGVETIEQKQYLLDNGCNSYQGYLFSKPIPIQEFNDLIQHYNLKSTSSNHE